MPNTNFKDKYEEYKKKINNQALIKKPLEYKKIYREYLKLEKILTLQDNISQAKKSLAENQTLLNGEEDPSMLALIEEEISLQKKKIASLNQELILEIIGNETETINSIIMEIRAGTGGDEASLFAAEMFRLYSKYADKKKWKLEILSLSESGINGIKEVIFNLKGKKVFTKLQYETGVHRVQRIPETESSGRIHTSAISIAVLKEPEPDEIKILDKDVKVDTYRSSGAGGQHVNTTDSAIRLTHLPSGLVVTCQDERSQIKNRDKAFKVLRARLFERKEKERKKKFAQERKEQLGSGDRSEKIRTYNFPQGRVSEHRTKLTIYNLDAFMNGEIDEVIESLTQFYQEKKLLNQGL